MGRRKKWITGLACALQLLALPVAANDTSVGGTGVDLVSLEESSVQMKAEEITLTYDGGRWDVVARYTFDNPTDRGVDLQVGFPEVGCPKEEESDCHARSFLGLKTEVDGKPVAHRKGKLAQTERWSNHLGTFWLFDVSFPAKKTVSIVHRYKMDATIDSMGTSSVTYVTRTGSTWAGPIGRATFRYRVPPHTLHLQTNPTLGRPQAPQIVREGERPFLVVVFEKENWAPKDDLYFGFATAFSQYPVARLAPEVLAERAQKLGLDAGQLCPWKSPHGGEKIESAEQAQSCRNLVYARWGYPFKKELFRKLYYEGGKSWHTHKDYGSLSLFRDPAPVDGFDMKWVSSSERRLLQSIGFEGESEPKPPAAAPVAPARPKGEKEIARAAEDTDKPAGMHTSTAKKTAPEPKQKRGGCAWAIQRSPSGLGPWVPLLLMLFGAAARRLSRRGNRRRV